MPLDPKVGMFAAIQRDRRVAGLSVRALAEKYGVHRRTIRAALDSAFPPARKRPPPKKSKLDPFTGAIDDILTADLDAPRKQPHTARRIFNRLVEEWGMDGISYATVTAYVSARRPQIAMEGVGQNTFEPGLSSLSAA